MDSLFSWIDYYMEFADRLVQYSDNRSKLVEKIKSIYTSIEIDLPTLEKDKNVYDIDPFTVFGLFNKGITNENRIKILTAIADSFDIKAPVPDYFSGIPVLNNQKATFYRFEDNRGEKDIDNLWTVFKDAIDYSDNPSDANKTKFVHSFDTVSAQKGVKWNITMGLYWIRPFFFINLDTTNREMLRSMGVFEAKMVSGIDYVSLCEKLRSSFNSEKFPYSSFPDLSFKAWQSGTDKKKNDLSEDAILSDSEVNNKRYWIYSPGNNAEMWDEFYKAGIMAIRWGEIGDLTVFKDKEDMKVAMKKKIDPSRPYKMAAHATWQFSHEMKVGDVVYAKKGMHLVVGRGVVESDYYYDPDEKVFKNVRKVKWTHKGEWNHPGQAAMKTLTDITPYTEYVKELNSMFEGDDYEEDEDDNVTKKHPSYDSDSFLDEVYMDKSDYEMLTKLIREKKNVILQGAPGVGKTFAAKRLAYSMIGEMDPDRVMMVQFHQSYSYEDFIMGYRPVENGFELKYGVFYDFCKKAAIDSENEYFFIIDEINRGNLSKIFGELFMLIENDKRGVELKLLYKDEKFSVPKKLYIIGMMNTADRGLAMIDYALRRRFAFYDMNPGFKTEGFQSYQSNLGNSKFDSLIECVENLNDVISRDDSLGEGFRIGHSYFCNLSEVTDGKLSRIVEFEIIPLIKEYWFDEPDKVRTWTDNLRRAIR